MTLKCAASGQPEPSINWNFRKGQNVRVHGGTLAFPKVSLSDNGVYLCTASNHYGSVSAKVKLNVIEGKCLCGAVRVYTIITLEFIFLISFFSNFHKTHKFFFPQ